MKRFLLALTFLLLASPAWAGFDEGMAAVLRGDYAAALREFLPLAQQGDAGAQTNLGVMYHNGRGVPQDYAEAMKWFRLAAAQGHALAQHNLGFMYTNGQGVPQDYAETMKWYRLAAAQGRAEAQNNLGFMYHNGRGVPQDYVQAHMWYNLAASRLSPGKDRDAAVEYRDIVARKMTPAQLAEAQRLAREWKPKSGK